METTRGAGTRARIDAIGISKREFADRADLDRGTLDRALSDDPKVSARTWAKIENLLVALEDELGMAESGHLVVSTVTIGDTAVTIRGTSQDVADTLRQILDSSS